MDQQSSISTIINTQTTTKNTSSKQYNKKQQLAYHHCNTTSITKSSKNYKSSSSLMDSKKSNKIRDIVRLQQLLKKWKHLAKTNGTRSRSGTCTPTTPTTTTISNGGSKSIKFLRKTLSFSDSMISSSSSSSSSSSDVVRKGFLAVCVGKELKRYVIPTDYLSHQAFGILLREAEEEFGFQQEGVLKIPCEVGVFEMILKVVEEKRDEFFLHELDLLNGVSASSVGRCSSSPECDKIFPSPAHPQLCR